MKAIKTYVVLVYNTGNHLPKSCSNTATYRFNVGAKSEREAEEFVKGWLAEHDLTARTRPPRTYFEDATKSLKYKEIERVFPNGGTIVLT